MALVISSDLVGEPIKGLDVSVEWRHTMNYAAAVGDHNTAYLDDTRSGGIIAPPMFAVALTWPIMADIQSQLGSAIDPAVIMTMVHSSEHLAFTRPIRPGDRLRLQGKVAAVKALRSGALVVLRIEALDGKGENVFTEHAGALFRGVACDGPDKGVDDLPTVPDAGSAEGEGFSEAITISPGAAHVYDGCTDIVFPIHTSQAFARAVGLPGIIYQGTATLAQSVRAIIDHQGADPARVSAISCRFGAMIFPGSSIRVYANCGNGDVYFSCTNQDNQLALKEGFLSFKES